MEKVLRVKGYANLGDHVYALAGLKQFCRDNSCRLELYTALDIPAFYYPGATHETVDGNGQMVMMSSPQFNMFKPLILSQEWIKSYEPWKGEQVDLDLSEIHHRNVNLPYGYIARWPSYLYPNLATDLSKPWLNIQVPEDIKEAFSNKILICRTARYQNPHISYWFLKEHQENLLFIGTEKECAEFNSKWELKIPYLKVYTFLHLAQVIKASQFLVSNQTFIFSLAEAMKTKRVMEICPMAPNVIPTGEHAYDFLHQGALEYYFDLLDHPFK